ncbi:MAG TPA: DUF1543 domain-containing protein [Mucilaginibacter sp.]|jgi:hypothetical protein|nr:DUF1543 domain-containing protein [Mucilaginibacter sp.]
MSQLKLFMLLLGCKPPGRHTEQHDIFFGIANSLNDLVPEIKAFWPQPDRIHIDAWREVNSVDGYRISVSPKQENADANQQKLFFVNLGGYLPNRFEEQHYVVLTVKANRAAAFKEAKGTLFYQHNGFAGANSHIDDKYGIDVDDLYQIEDILSPEQKALYQINIEPASDLPADPVHLGYLKLSTLEKEIG